MRSLSYRARVRVPSLDDGVANLADAGVPGQGDGATTHHLDPVPLLRVVGRGDDGPSVEVATPDGEVEHVRSDHPHVLDAAAPRGRSFDERRRDDRRARANVPTHGDVSRAEEIDEGSADLTGDGAVDLGRIDPTNVIGLEDGGVGHQGLRGTRADQEIGRE